MKITSEIQPIAFKPDHFYSRTLLEFQPDNFKSFGPSKIPMGWPFPTIFDRFRPLTSEASWMQKQAPKCLTLLLLTGKIVHLIRQHFLNLPFFDRESTKSQKFLCSSSDNYRWFFCRIFSSRITLDWLKFYNRQTFSWIVFRKSLFIQNEPNFCRYSIRSEPPCCKKTSGKKVPDKILV